MSNFEELIEQVKRTHVDVKDRILTLRDKHQNLNDNFAIAGAYELTWVEADLRTLLVYWGYED